MIRALRWAIVKWIMPKPSAKDYWRFVSLTKAYSRGLALVDNHPGVQESCDRIMAKRLR